MTFRPTRLNLLFLAALSPSLLIAQEIVITEEDLADDPVYSPYAGRAYADNVWYSP